MTLRIGLFLCCFFLFACSQEGATPEPQADQSGYFVLDENLSRLREDFNAHSDKLRLFFISGPSCGICLRGMDDLNEAIVGALQNDPRVQTFVLYVPTLGAKEHHVAAAIPLMQGPYVDHYWDPNGRSGRAFQATLKLDMYAWDLWFIYPPDAVWEAGENPPMPVFWQHQLPGLPEDKKLNAEEFAQAVRSRLSTLPPAAAVAAPTTPSSTGAALLSVAQPLGVAIQMNHGSRGGYASLKNIRRITYQGETEIDGVRQQLTITSSRPNFYERKLVGPTGTSLTRFDGTRLTASGDADFSQTFASYLSRYEFDGWLTDWKDKGHQVRRLGMKKLGEKLPWVTEVKLDDDEIWHLYIDSHSGDLLRQAMVVADGNEVIALEYADFRDADGFRLPHLVRYFADARLVATDRYAQVSVASEL